MSHSEDASHGRFRTTSADQWLARRERAESSLLVDLIRKHTGIRLVEAKRILDELTEASVVRLSFASLEGADAFVEDAVALGLRRATRCQIRGACEPPSGTTFLTRLGYFYP
jgi:hypothetical protein